VNLTEEKEPQIYRAIRFGSVLENVILNETTREPDFADISFDGKYAARLPVDFIENALIPGIGGHPHNVMFLAADAFGVLAAHRAADAGAGHVPLPVGVYGEAGRTETGVKDRCRSFRPASARRSCR